MSENYYKVLGVNRSASQKEIRDAYRKMARQYHPDINRTTPESENTFKKINEAYDVLGDEKRRKDYNDFGDNWKHANQIRSARQNGNFGGYNIDFNMGDILGNFGLGDIFSGIRKKSRPQAKVKTEATITLKEVLYGTKRTIEVENKGAKRKIEITIAQGIKNGQKMVVHPKGLEIVVTVFVEKHPVYRRENNDLIADVELPLKTAILGGKVKFKTLENKEIELKIASGTQNKQHIRISGKGLFDPKSSKRGDLILIADVKLPKLISKELKNFAKKIPD